MEESRMRVKLGRVSFSKNAPQSNLMKERVDTIGENRTLESYIENVQQPTFHHQFEISGNPDKAMEFLSTTWSPCSFDFSQILSSNNLVPRLDHETCDDKEEGLEEELNKNKINTNGDARTTVEQILTLLSSSKLAQLAPQKHKSLSVSWMSGDQMKNWFGGKILSNLTRGGRKKRKEELRLHAAQIHAALSVTRLAAAIAGIVDNCSLQPTSSERMKLNCEWDHNASKVVSSAAALVATVCAKAAESVGANREHVASVIRTGLATQSSADMITLTANTATCLRCAATLELRTTARMNISEDQKILARGAQLLVRAPEGRIQLRTVWIYLKNEKLALKLGKKHLRGVISTCREYRIFDAIDNPKDSAFSKDEHNFLLITLSTTGGTIQVLFEDPKLYSIWNTTISHLLCEC